jgi:hypothetical protein
VVLGLLFRFVLGSLLAGIGRIESVQPELVPRFDAELLTVVQGFEPPARRVSSAAPGSIVIGK